MLLLVGQKDVLPSWRIPSYFGFTAILNFNRIDLSRLLCVNQKNCKCQNYGVRYYLSLLYQSELSIVSFQKARVRQSLKKCICRVWTFRNLLFILFFNFIMVENKI